jgi:hypothetical protein
MDVDPANANELAQIGREVGADVLEGALSYPSKTGNWPSGVLTLVNTARGARRCGERPPYKEPTSDGLLARYVPAGIILIAPLQRIANSVQNPWAAVK